MRSSPISAADLIRAFAELRPSSEKQKREIAELLGFSWPEATETSKPTTKTKKKTKPAAESKRDVTEPAPPAVPEGEVEIPWQQTILGFALTGPQPGPINSPQWRLQNTVFSIPAKPPANPGPIAPLLVPHWTRSILSTALSRRTYDGIPDVARMVEMMLRQVLIRELPRLPSFSMVRAIQILLDVGDNMLPFTQDQRGLLAVIRRLAGNDVEVLKFVGTPLRKAGASDITSWKDYRLPVPGTQVLLLTDLGIAKPSLTSKYARAAEWSDFARLLRSGGIQATAFVPYPRDHWPRSLRNLLRIVEWDRRTTAASVRFAPQTEGRP